MAFGRIASEWDANAQEYSNLPVDVGPLAGPAKRMLGAMESTSTFATASGILDIGCGPGTAVTLLINNYGKDIPEQARLIASDFSAGMLEATKARKDKMVAESNDIAKKNSWGRLETVALDAQDLSTIPSGSLSHVMGSLVYFMLPDPRKGLSEAKRVLKDGGVFACTSWSRVDWQRYLLEAARRVRADAPGGFDPADFGPWKDVEGVKAELEAAGFRNVHAEYIELEIAPNPAQYAKFMVRSKNPGTTMVVGDFSEEELDQACKEWANIVKENGDECKGVAVLGVGTK